MKFLSRINTFEKSIPFFGSDAFTPDINLKAKVENNLFKKFYGDTMVFLPDEVTVERLFKIQNHLYFYLPQCFAERLLPETFHMTLHDLNNSQDIAAIKNELIADEERIALILKEYSEQNITVEMKSHNIFNMVDTSLVLGVLPQNKREYEKLITLYRLFDEIKPLPYPFTPHITIAYFSDYGFTEADSEKLCRVVELLNRDRFSFTLCTKRLVYQHFTDMNNFKTIL